VPFRGREEELATLAEWCDSGEEIGIRLYTGAGGMGKTRLMLRACELRRRAGWRAGFLDEEASQELFAAKALGDLFSGGKPLLLVVDYAERRRETLERLLARLAAAYPPQPVRLLLVARHAGDWWGDLQGIGKGGGDLLRGPAAALPREIRPLVPKDYERSAAFEEAVKAFAEKLGKKPPDLPPLNLDDPTFDRALYLHAAALQAVLGGEPTADAAELLDFLLDREGEHLEKQAAAEGLELSRKGLTQAAALATLAGPLPDVGNAAEVLRRAPRLKGKDADAVERVADLLHELYPARVWLNGVQPDLLGEHLVEAEIDHDGRLREAALGVGVEDERREAALTVLTRSAQRRWALGPTVEARQAGRERLEEALAVDLPGLAELAMKVSVETDVGYGERSGALLGDALGEVLERSGDYELARRLVAKMPETTTALRLAAEVATRLCRDELRTRNPNDEEGRSELARLNSNLSVRLSELGRREEALSAIEEAVVHYRDLSSTRPEAFLPDLAGSLNNLSLRLSELGRREEALLAIEEAVEILIPFFGRHPAAFAMLAEKMLGNLRDLSAALDREPDTGLVDGLEKVFARLGAGEAAD